MKKVVFLLSLILSISMILSACGPAGSSAATIKVGGIGELTGDIPAVGASFKNAATMAVQEINDAGGLDVGGKHRLSGQKPPYHAYRAEKVCHSRPF